MSYTVLARKWRPKKFSELVGQSHVMQALSNALDQKRLHHAYLFTGTRGVGKTTIARIFAKALNCEQGVTSDPCGTCVNCTSIDEGRFVDLIEVDAASKTKVDDTRELLDNVQYAAVQGQYKVYLIDEVHMLSKSSFNALLKTLEEPPEHVKFLLATTDPHKLPMTVLSRCLQFNLMRLTTTQLQNHLAYILQQEAVPFEESALALIAKSADGSARDSLSILDQAIAFGAGEVNFSSVQAMLGLVDKQFSALILQALMVESAEQLKDVLQKLAAMGVDYSALLAQLIEALHQIALVQVLGEMDDMPEAAVLDKDVLQNLARGLSPQKTQMLYQIALLGRQDMNLAPDERIGFEMTMLRMLAFVPANHAVSLSVTKDSQPETSILSEMKQSSSEVSYDMSVASLESEYLSQTNPAAVLKQKFVDRKSIVVEKVEEPDEKETSVVSQSTGKSHLEDLQSRLKETLGKPKSLVSATGKKQSFPESEAPLLSALEPVKKDSNHVEDTIVSFVKVEENSSLDISKNGARVEECLPIEVWLGLIEEIKPEGMAEALASQSILLLQEESRLVLSVDPEQKIAKTDLAVQRLQEAVYARLGVNLEFSDFKGEYLTPSKDKKNKNNMAQKSATQAVYADYVVQDFISLLNLRVIESSIKFIQ